MDIEEIYKIALYCGFSFQEIKEMPVFILMKLLEVIKNDRGK